MTPRLVIFDVDGTLIDSQAHIVAAMEAGFASVSLDAPSRADILSIVGLSLPVAMARLAPHRPDLHSDLVNGYKGTFADLRMREDGVALSPLYPGAREALEVLSKRSDTLLGIATGKSRRGMEHVFGLHGFREFFHTVQVADDHPSKPHPSMIETAMREIGVEAADTIMLGDTTYDIEMASAAGVVPLGVNWGYHSADALKRAGAAEVLDSFAALPSWVQGIFGKP